jgi:hypothetical protein
VVGYPDGAHGNTLTSQKFTPIATFSASVRGY